MFDKKTIVAVIDDNVGDAELLRRRLTEIPDLDLEFLYFEDAERGIDALLRKAVDFIFVELRAGAQTGLNVLKAFRDAGNLHAIIILAAENDAQIAAEMIRAGADDYLMKDDLSPGVLKRSMLHANERFRRRESERNQRELLTKTLAGSVRMLVDLLAAAKPKSFGRAVRVQKIVQLASTHLPHENAWEADLAAMLSQVGCAFVPDEILEKVTHERALTPAEAERFYQHPAITSEMIRRIPRLGGVAAVVAYQEKHFDGGGHPVKGLSRENIPLGARILKLALDFDTLKQRGVSDDAALETLRRRTGRYDLNVLAALEAAMRKRPAHEADHEVMRVSLAEIEPYMVLDAHLETEAGAIIVPRGETVTLARRERLLALAAIEPVREPVTVRVPRDDYLALSAPG